MAHAKGIKVGDPSKPPPHQKSPKNPKKSENDANANNRERVSSVPH